MTKYLLTPSLHDSLKWFLRLDSKTKEEFLSTLNKEEFEKSEAMLNGIQFEDNVLAYTKGQYSLDVPPSPYQECVAEIGDIVQGGLWQERVYKDIKIDGQSFLLYGRTDVIKRDWIYDIKFSKSYDIGKYQSSIQHLTYMSCTGIENFAYLISNGRNVFREDYFWLPECEERLIRELRNTVNFIMDDPDFRNAFEANWECKYQDKKEAA